MRNTKSLIRKAPLRGPDDGSPERVQALPATKRVALKRLTSAIAALLLTVAVLASSGTVSPSAASAEPARGVGHAHGFERFLQRYEDANTAFVNGDPAPWLSIAAEKDPASIFGGFGGPGEAGTANVHRRYLLAAGAFRPSGARVDFDYLVKDVSGKLAYTVATERANVLYAGHTERQQQVLRSTMIFRFEKGAWKIVHRHADTMVDLQLPTPPR